MCGKLACAFARSRLCVAGESCELPAGSDDASVATIVLNGYAGVACGACRAAGRKCRPSGMPCVNLACGWHFYVVVAAA
eukprot:1175337-Lingulodinium_polyedra.AAC.1